MRGPGYVLVVNPHAGQAAREQSEAARHVLDEASPTQLLTTTDPADVDEAIAALDGRTLVVAGGDGTLHVAVNRLAAAGILASTTIGIVPAGTGNDFARSLGIPQDPAAAARALLAYQPRSVDLLEADDGQLAVNAVHAGLGAEASQRSVPLKDDLGALAYPVGALVAGVRETGWTLEVEVDGAPVSQVARPVLMVGIANAGCIGGGTPLCAPAEPDDGRLDVVVVAAVGPAARAAFGAALQRGRHLTRDDVEHVRGQDVRILGDPVRYNADGELSRPLRQRRYRIRPAAWRVLAPPR